MDPIEQEIQAKGLTAPRITPADIEANIAREYFFTAQEGIYGKAAFESDSETPVGGVDYVTDHEASRLTFCVLVLRNGFTVTGESAPILIENFDAELGRKIARQNAVSKVWPLMGYELRSQLAARVDIGGPQ